LISRSRSGSSPAAGNSPRSDSTTMPSSGSCRSRARRGRRSRRASGESA
jgi:hypothetical protein